MLEFKKVELTDREFLQNILMKETDRGCEYTFGNLFMWGKVYGTHVAKFLDGAVIKYSAINKFLYPVGVSDVEKTIQAMIESEQNKKDFSIISLSKNDCDELERIFPNRFLFEDDEIYGEYVYNSEDLIELKGKKYHSKRNHISRFIRENPDYKFVEITKDNINSVIEMNEKWCKTYGCNNDDGLSSEYCATSRALKNFFDLPFDGAFIESDKEIVAYSVGEAITDKTYCVHIEKAFHQINGAYTIINRDFAKRYAEKFELINREDAAGEEGLIKAKLSYNPAFVSEKYIATLKD